jgi:taurine--2-oxoglutarate transaminase
MTITDEALTNAAVQAADKAHVFHSWSAQDLINPIPLAGGEGCVFWDYDGNRYLDFSSQLINLNLGHQHPRIVAAIVEQAQRHCMVAPSFGSHARNEAARLITEHAPGELSHVFFTNGGADANEHAIRMARLHTGRHKVLAMYRSYHGGTAGAISLTGDPRRWPSEPLISGVVRFMGPYLYRSPWGATTEAEEAQRALAHLDEVLMLEGPANVAAIIVEPVVGTNGVLVPPDGYLQGVREICDRHGIMLIADEVMVGFGRTGRWFSVDHWNVVPDMITFAKGVNSGYVPLGGVILSPAIRAAFSQRAYPGGLTYSGHPLACASAVGAITAMEDEGIVEHADRLGREVFGPELGDLAERHPSVGEVRGLGCFWAVELVRDRATREMLVPFNAAGEAAKPMVDVLAACKAQGVWPFTHFNRVHLAPPLIATAEQVRQGIAALDAALEVADALVTG